MQATAEQVQVIRESLTEIRDDLEKGTGVIRQMEFEPDDLAQLRDLAEEVASEAINLAEYLT